jgi:hypothetical protein
MKKKSPKRVLFAEMFSSFSVEPQLRAIGDIVDVAVVKKKLTKEKVGKEL